MNREQELKVQAYLDGELPEREARQVREWLAENAQAQRLLAELTWARTALSENEPEARIAESREFYWSKIKLAIERHAWVQRRQTACSLLDLLLGLRRLFAPLAGVALAAMLVVGIVNYYEVSTPEAFPAHLAQIESPSEDVGAFSFRSQSDNVFVVWLYDRPTQASLSRELLDKMVIQ